jgi:ABC-2 type transport system ATP-binding protein
VTSLVTTHLMEEADLCDRIVVLHLGKVVAEGAPDALKREIGDDVVTIETRDPAAFAAKVNERFDADAKVDDGRVRVSRAEGHRFVPQLVDAFPKEVDSIAVGKPTLEDVFLKRTGHKFFEVDRAAAEAEAAKSKGRRR